MTRKYINPVNELCVDICIQALMDYELYSKYLTGQIKKRSKNHSRTLKWYKCEMKKIVKFARTFWLKSFMDIDNTKILEKLNSIYSFKKLYDKENIQNVN